MAVRGFDEAFLTWLFVGLTVLGLSFAVSILRVVRQLSYTPYEFVRVEDRGPDVAGYLAAYLLPFVTGSDPSGLDLAAYGLFLFVAGVIYVQSEMIQINPTLYLLGYKVVAVQTESGWSVHLITKSRPTPGDKVHAVRLSTGVLVEVRGP